MIEIAYRCNIDYASQIIAIIEALTHVFLIESIWIMYPYRRPLYIHTSYFAIVRNIILNPTFTKETKTIT
jgi:hypothetical protein